jgi:glycosyltransferase involved in cell wall biosynthesis
MMMKKPRISVLIPTKNRSASLAQCLESLTKQSFTDFEVVIVDGGSTNETKKVVERYSTKLQIILDFQGGGLIQRENKGWQISNGEIVIRTDDDVITTPKWLDAVSQTFAISNDIGGVTGPTIIPQEKMRFRDLFFFQEKLKNGGYFWRFLGKIYSDYFMEGQLFAVGRWFKSGAFSLGSNYPKCLKLKEPLEVDHHEACNMAIKKTLLSKIGGFDETYIGLGEYNEPDVSFKIINLGYRILFNPAAAVFHVPSEAGVFNERPNSYGRALNFVNFYFRHICPTTIDKFVRFLSYLGFLNGFWFYKFITTKQTNQLGSIKGTIVGLAKNTPKKPIAWVKKKGAH